MKRKNLKIYEKDYYIMTILVENLEVARQQLINLVFTNDYRRRFAPEIDFRQVVQNYTNSMYSGKITNMLFKIVSDQISKLRPYNYIRSIVFLTPINAVMYIKAFNENFVCESDYYNLRPNYYSIQYCNDNSNSSAILADTLFKQRVQLEIEFRMNVKEAEMQALEEKVENFDQLIDRCAGLESECEKLFKENMELKKEREELKTANLDLETGLTAISVANSCLEENSKSNIDCDNVEWSIARQKQMRYEITKLKAQLGKKRKEIKVLKNKLDFTRGQKDMIRDVLNGGTLVVHREAAKNAPK